MKISTKRSKSGNAIINVISNSSYQIINMVINLILPPLIMGKFGSAINGLISAIKQIISYIQLVGTGIAESTVVTLYKPLAEKDETKISAIFNASSKAFWKAGIIFSFASILLAIIYPFFIKEDLNKLFVGILVLVLCIAGASEFFVIGKCRTLLIADQRIYIVNIAQIIGAISTLIGTFIMIKVGANIILVQLVASCAYILRLILIYHYIKKHYTYLDNTVPPDNTATSRRKAATIHQLTAVVVLGSQTIVVSKFIGLAEASVYSVYALIFTGINTLLSTLSSALLANFGHIIANENRDKLLRTYNIYEFIYMFLSIMIYSVAYMLILPFIEIYTANVLDATNYIRPLSATLFCIMGIISSIRTPGVTLITAIGHYDETKNRAIIEMLICFFGECILVNFWGMNGVIIGTLLAFTYRTVDIIIYSNKYILERPCIFTIKRIFINLCGGLIMICISQFIPLNIHNYFSWAGYGLLFTAIAFIIFFTLNFLFYRVEISSILYRFRQIVKK